MYSKIKKYFEQLNTRYVRYLIWLSKKRSRAGLYEFLECEFSNIMSGTKVLTVGSGGDVNELLLEHSREKCFDVISFDIDENREPDIVGDICTADLGISVFDTVVICEVLEHLHSPKQAIDTIYSTLKPGGKIILSAPFCLPIHDHPNDYFRFTKYGIGLLLNKFKQVTIHERNSYLEAIDVIWMRMIMEDRSNVPISNYILLPFIYFVKRPITLVLDKFVALSGNTTGYVATAIK